VGKSWSLWYRIARFVLRWFFFTPLGGFKVLGVERVPLEGPLIVAPVHLSLLDPPSVGTALPRGLRFMAKEELFRFKPFAALIRSLGSFPVRRGSSDTEAIRRAIAELEQGHAVLVFPEGTRNDGKTMRPINRGVAMLAKRTGANVLPVGLCGTNRVFGRTVVCFGHPFTFAETAGRGDAKQDAEAFSETLRERVLAATREAGLNLE